MHSVSSTPSQTLKRCEGCGRLSGSFIRHTVKILCIGTDRSQQTVQTKIRLLLKKQSDQGLRCFPLHQLLFGCINAMLHQTLPILEQLWQLFEVSQILEFLRYLRMSVEFIDFYTGYYSNDLKISHLESQI